jgi:hypothetical protein
MTNQDFRTALENGKTKVTYTDIDGKKYIHTILKAGNIQVNLFNNFLNKEYKLTFRNHKEFKQYELAQ